MKISKFLILLLVLATMPILSVADKAFRHVSGNVDVSVTDFGSFTAFRGGGFADNFEYPKGSGKHYLQQFSEIWIGDAKGNVATAWNLTNKGVAPLSGNWRTTDTGEVTLDPKPDGRQIVNAQYDPHRIKGFPLDLLIDQQSFSWSTKNHPEYDDFLILKLTITNPSAVSLKGIYVALSTNWNVDGEDMKKGQLSTDMMDWNEENRMLFAFDADSKDGLDPVHVGTTLISGNLAAHQIYTFRNIKGQVDVGVFNDANRSLFMSNPNFLVAKRIGGRSKADLIKFKFPPWDYIGILSSGPYTIRAGKSISVTFALVAGKSLSELKQNASNAKTIAYASPSITAKVVKGGVEIVWEKPISFVGGYQLFRRIEGDEEFEQIGPRIIEGAVFPDTDVQYGIEYTYKVSPVDYKGTPIKSYSKEVTVMPDFIPDPPVGMTGESTTDGNYFLLKLPKPTQKISQYIIYRNHTGEPPWTPIATVKPDTTNFTDMNIYPDHQYFYALAGTNRSGDIGDIAIMVNPETEEPVSLEITGSPRGIAKLDLQKVIAYPNPFQISRHETMIFDNLTARAMIYIYDGSGTLIQQLEHIDKSPSLEWGPKNWAGESLSPGVYVYYVEDIGSVKTHDLVNDEQLPHPWKIEKLTHTGKFVVIN